MNTQRRRRCNFDIEPDKPMKSNVQNTKSPKPMYLNSIAKVVYVGRLYKAAASDTDTTCSDRRPLTQKFSEL